MDDTRPDAPSPDPILSRLTRHHGLIAQEVRDVLATQGIDFGGFQDHAVNGGEDVLSLGYDELIAPMIKAIQEQQIQIGQFAADRSELHDQVRELLSKNDDQQGQIAELRTEMSQLQTI